ncbi:MAG: prepilin-type N-terminal cleavage/methylation domain-containing protein [Pseudohongiella sp.]|nr:prepilin-type N-terminal cleavage/methylation domain-containing protein [Pseudohongiella sp.]MDP2126532.1 prepilin-type N-terminal cleavage/methylation domain-containing protein [Pseudohongiella sp.]
MKSIVQQGFTLVEMVITILIAAILSVGIVNYIGDSVEGFSSSANRNRLASSGRTVLDRLAMELHNAVPNSVRTRSVANQQCIEYVPFIRATSYVDPAFNGPPSDVFDMVVLNPSLTFPPHDPLTDPPRKPLYAVIYPISVADLYLDAAQASSPGIIAGISSIQENIDHQGRLSVALENPHLFRLRSPVNRIYIAESPVSFCMVDSRIFRYSDYGFHAQQPTPLSECPPSSGTLCLPETSPSRRLITDRVVNTGVGAFEVIAATLRRNAIVSITLAFEDQGDVVNLKHEVLLRNVP